jgi:RNA polymerase sigma-70 factor (ECF subfamily)
MTGDPAENGSDSAQRCGFPTTRWSCVLAAAEPAGPEAREALAELCAAYWPPVYAFIRRKGHDPERALDLTQDYFARLIEKGTVAAAAPAKGRFRSFLLADCGYFLADRRDREGALKRGGGRRVLSIDAQAAEEGLIREPSHSLTPERLFERDWALALLGRVFDRLEQDYAGAGRGDAFRLLRPVLSGDPDAAPYAAIAAELGTTEGNIQVAVHRLRARFGAELRRQVAATLDDPGDAEVDAELAALFETLGR